MQVMSSKQEVKEHSFVSFQSFNLMSVLSPELESDHD